MLSTNLESPNDVSLAVADRARAARLAANLSQQGLAERAGVSLGSLKRFERSAAVSLDALVRIAVALRLEGGFDALFRSHGFASLDEVIATPRKRQRGRSK
jgi:transcriptional regulator with XRE-family HTH domain